MISQEQFKIDNINKLYDSHIYRVSCIIKSYRDDKREIPFLRLKTQLDLLIIDKDLFNLTHGFDLHDWNLIRDDKYYDARDQIGDELNRKIFLQDRVRKYIANKISNYGVN